MNKQEIFEKVARHLLSMPHQALLNPGDPHSNSCAYRDPRDGTPCAIGVLLTDAEYEVIRGHRGGLEASVAGLDNYGLLPVRLAAVGTHGFLTDLQGIHDNESNWQGRDLPAKRPKLLILLHKFATRHELNGDFLDDTSADL